MMKNFIHVATLLLIYNCDAATIMSDQCDGSDIRNSALKHIELKENATISYNNIFFVICFHIKYVPLFSKDFTCS